MFELGQQVFIINGVAEGKVGKIVDVINEGKKYKVAVTPATVVVTDSSNIIEVVETKVSPS